MDPDHTPSPVLTSQPDDERGQLLADRLAPLRGDQAAAPPQQRRWGDDPVSSQELRQHPGQSGKDTRSVQVTFGFGLPRRRTITSWRSTSISTSFDAEERASSATQESSLTKSR